jgi:hypothetical protein
LLLTVLANQQEVFATTVLKFRSPRTTVKSLAAAIRAAVAIDGYRQKGVNFGPKVLNGQGKINERPQ